MRGLSAFLAEVDEAGKQLCEAVDEYHRAYKQWDDEGAPINDFYVEYIARVALGKQAAEKRLREAHQAQVEHMVLYRLTETHAQLARYPPGSGHISTNAPEYAEFLGALLRFDDYGFRLFEYATGKSYSWYDYNLRECLDGHVSALAKARRKLERFIPRRRFVAERFLREKFPELIVMRILSFV